MYVYIYGNNGNIWYVEVGQRSRLAEMGGNPFVLGLYHWLPPIDLPRSPFDQQAMWFWGTIVGSGGLEFLVGLPTCLIWSLQSQPVRWCLGAVDEPNIQNPHKKTILFLGCIHGFNV